MSDEDAIPDPNPTLPARARRSLNRCNLPAVILGSLTFQHHPTALALDGVATLHRDLFERLARLDDAAARAAQFMDYVNVHFRLDRPEEVGWSPATRRDRRKASYLGTIRGWMFNPDGREAAVLKGWIESRFGLCPRHHAGPIRGPGDARYQTYLEQWADGLYNANALEAQLDLLYAYGQHELGRQFPDRTHFRLHRGVNHLDEHEVLWTQGRKRLVILNNLSSFTRNRERAEEFGDYIMTADVPLSKVAFMSGLLPRLLHGEEEVAVIGGVYEVDLGS